MKSEKEYKSHASVAELYVNLHDVSPACRPFRCEAVASSSSGNGASPGSTSSKANDSAQSAIGSEVSAPSNPLSCISTNAPLPNSLFMKGLTLAGV